MDRKKCSALKEKLSSMQEPLLLSVEGFFDGNDDEGSIGCNLFPHPGIDFFRTELDRLKSIEGIAEVYVLVYEVDTGEDYWPYAENLIVSGSISLEDLQKELKPLQFDDIWTEDDEEILKSISGGKSGHVFNVWWD